MKSQLAIGVDLGATKIATALVSRDGAMLDSRQAPTLANEGPDAVCKRIADEVRALTESAPDEVIGAGIGSAGLVDAQTGIVKWALNLNWKDVPLSLASSRHLNNLDVFIDNDANANALGEGYFGSAKGLKNYVLLTIGSGLGSGLVYNGKLVNGTQSLVSNLGHYSIDPDHGLACGCGNRGCAETLVGGPALVAIMQTMRPGPQHVTPDHVLALARSGNDIAQTAIAKMSSAVGQVASIAATVLGAEMVIIGGGLGIAASDLIIPHVEFELKRRLPPPQFVPPVRVATLASPAVGAATLVWERSTKTRSAGP
jgi:glucokinase